LLRHEVGHVVEAKTLTEFRYDEGARALAETSVRHSDNGYGLNGGMPEQQALDLDHRDVLTAANDDPALTRSRRILARARGRSADDGAGGAARARRWSPRGKVQKFKLREMAKAFSRTA
jgi:hypothetical protein